MFQRKQTLFWIAALALTIVQFFRTYGAALIPFPGGRVVTVDFFFDTYWPVAALLCMVTVIQIINLFLYKKHALQIRLTGVVIVLLLGLQVLVGYCLWRLPEIGLVKYDIIDVFPVISAILNFFAFKRVSADYALIKSLGRLR